MQQQMAVQGEIQHMAQGTPVARRRRAVGVRASARARETASAPPSSIGEGGAAPSSGPWLLLCTAPQLAAHCIASCGARASDGAIGRSCTRACARAAARRSLSRTIVTASSSTAASAAEKSSPPRSWVSQIRGDPLHPKDGKTRAFTGRANSGSHTPHPDAAHDRYQPDIKILQ